MKDPFCYWENYCVLCLQKLLTFLFFIFVCSFLILLFLKKAMLAWGHRTWFFWAGRTICPQVRFPSHITWLIKGHLKGNLKVPLSMVGGDLKRGHMWKRVGRHTAGQNLGFHPDNVQQCEGPLCHLHHSGSFPFLSFPSRLTVKVGIWGSEHVQ